MRNINHALQSDSLIKLVAKQTFVGWVYSIDYDSALVMTNDLWKKQARGIPHNCFLVAVSFNPEAYSAATEDEQEVLLLRVIGSAKLPQDDDVIRTKIDNRQEQEDVYGSTRDLDDLTLGHMQFGGLACRVLGTFYMSNDKLHLGSDLESFTVATTLRVYRPRGDALKTIVNHVDPIRLHNAHEEAKQLGLQKPVEPFPIGTVRYTSTDRLHRHTDEDKVPVCIQPSDFLARRTAVLGMTRTGKSNMIKQLVAVVKRVADQGGIKIGQIIYDINGEYANANQQDKGAIADVYPQDTVRYRMVETLGFEELQNNFYIQINEGFTIIRRVITEKKRGGLQTDLEVFLSASFDEPDAEDKSSYNRWKVKVAAYQALLHKAEFPAPSKHKLFFEANINVRNAVKGAANEGARTKDPKQGLSLDDAVEWFLAAREANMRSQMQSSSGKPWLDNEIVAILNMLAGYNENTAFIRGYRELADAKKYHSPRRTQEVGDEIYQHLVNGKIVILDLSVGDPMLREKISIQIASTIFNKSMATFVASVTPPNVVVYIEEAHNLIGKDMDLTETWPRLAKEGAKYRIALVYATQEVSSVHRNILANTENWFVTHLNNEREIKELGHFYDFEDFSKSLLRAQDVGFARVKTLSGPFVIPVQIDKFDPEAEKKQAAAYQKSKSSSTQSILF